MQRKILRLFLKETEGLVQRHTAPQETLVSKWASRLQMQLFPPCTTAGTLPVLGKNLQSLHHPIRILTQVVWHYAHLLRLTYASLRYQRGRSRAREGRPPVTSNLDSALSPSSIPEEVKAKTLESGISARKFKTWIFIKACKTKRSLYNTAWNVVGTQ